MYKLLTLHITIMTLLVSFFNEAKANDSDIVNCGRSFKIVVLGSSTSYGYGATPIDSSWVNKFTAYTKRKNSQNTVINLGIPGFTTYNALCPDGFVPPPNRPSPTPDFNITAALSYHPDAIIINLPTNDVVNNYTLIEQKANFERTVAMADSAHILVWVTTTQPRNFMSTAQVDSLIAMRDWIQSRFGNKSVDFWSTVANTNGSIATLYDYDYAHVNNLGHDLFCKRMMAESILDSLCNRLNLSPIARAGNDTSIILPSGSLGLNGSTSSDANGTIVSYQWTKISGPANYQVVSPASATTTVNNLTEGIYKFELTVTDNDAAVGKDTIQVTVNSRILVDIGLSSDFTTSPDNGGKYWNNMTSAQLGVRVQNAITTANTSTAVTLDVINRIDGTFNEAGPGCNTGNTIGAVGDYPNSATTDYAFAHTSTTNGKWKFTGLDSLKRYTFKFWGTRSADTRFTQIKRSDQITWQEYDAGMNSSYTNAAYFTFAGKSEMSFDIKVKDGSPFGYISVVDILSTYAGNTNIPPVARAGNDTLLILPANSLTLNGTNSTDADESIVSYQWTKISGPANYQVNSPANASTTVSNLESGTYTFRLTVTDNTGASSSDTINITVTNSLRILIDIGLGSTQTTSPDAGGKYWNNMTIAQPGVRIQNAITTNNVATTLDLEVVSRIDGTFNEDGPGCNSGNTIGDVGDYPNSATTDYAFAHTSTDNGKWKFTGLDSSKNYTFKFWGTKSADDRHIRIKRADQLTWQEYDAGMNSSYTNAAYFSFAGKTEMSFDIRVKNGSPFGYISVVDINMSSNDIVCTQCPTTADLQLFLQGYYTGSRQMQPVLNNQSIENSSPDAVDTITAELYDPSTFNLVASTKGILKTNGKVSLVFPHQSGNYYIAIKHRNTLQTWTAIALSFNSTNVLYDFSTAAGKAYGNTLIEMEPGVWALYSGDLNHDDNIDQFDSPSLVEDVDNGSIFGYYITDLNGDGNVDQFDSPVLSENVNNSIFFGHP